MRFVDGLFFFYDKIFLGFVDCKKNAGKITDEQKIGYIIRNF